MQFSPEQMSIIEDALQYASNVLTDEFEQKQTSDEKSDAQRSVQVYGQIRRINRLLNEIRRYTGARSPTACQPINGSAHPNVLVLNRRR